jgi:anti-sigma regulatory factor (Ser/Thr protein kinase)
MMGVLVKTPDVGTCHGVEYLHEELVAAPDAPSAARRSLAGFLTAVGWSRRADLATAVSEAVTNAAQHAYPDTDPGLIVLRAQLVSDQQCRLRVWACVSDRGVNGRHRLRAGVCG